MEKAPSFSHVGVMIAKNTIKSPELCKKKMSAIKHDASLLVVRNKNKEAQQGQT
jgi:hypothetical protein